MNNRSTKYDLMKLDKIFLKKRKNITTQISLLLITNFVYRYCRQKENKHNIIIFIYFIVIKIGASRGLRVALSLKDKNVVQRPYYSEIHWQTRNSSIDYLMYSIEILTQWIFC